MNTSQPDPLPQPFDQPLQPFYPPQNPYPVPHRNGFGIASFVCGLTASVVGLIPILAIPALASAIVGLGLGLANTGRLRRKTADNKWMTILGIGFSVLGVVLAIVGIVIVTKATDKLTHDLNNLPTS